MMETQNKLTLLLVHDDIDEANRLVSLLRNANHIVDPHYAADASELSHKLHEQSWDMLLAPMSTTSVPAKNIIHLVRRSNKDIPVIFIIDGFNSAQMVEALRMGASDVVPVDEDQYIIQVVNRTLTNLEQRRKLRYWRRRFAESEDRFESLILSSQDGIAIIQDGTYVHINDSFAQFFGYSDTDSLTLLPVFDTVADSSHREFKQLLKPLDENDALDAETIAFEGVRADGSTLAVKATLSQIDFHGEPALQLLVKKHFIEGDLAESTGKPSTINSPEVEISKIRLHDMVEGINAAIRRAVKRDEDSLLFYLQVDQYEHLQKQFGIGKTEEGISELAKALNDMIPDKVLFGRIREEAFIVVMSSADKDKAISFGSRLSETISSKILNTTDGTFTCTLSIGITPIGEATASADEALSGCQKAVEDVRQKHGGNGVKFHEPVFEFNSSTLSDSDLEKIGSQIVKKELFTLAFQPTVSLQGRDDEFYEVIMRVAKEAFADGEIPADFVGKVFQTGIGSELDRAVISTALKKLAQKQAEAPATKLFIHISSATIADEKFVPWLKKTIDASGIASSDLVFQMREYDIGRNMGKAVEMQERLHNIGAGTGLSHFGLSINPLTVLNKVKADYLKLDVMLTEKASKDKKELENLKTLLTEIKQRQQKIIVPYIESATIIPTLWQAGVDYIQGHYIQPPSAEMSFDFSEE